MTSTSEYELLGYKVKFRPKTSNNIDPSQVVDLLLGKVSKVKSQFRVHSNEALLLAALKLAEERIVLEKTMKKDIDQLHSCATDALELIEEIIPQA